MIAGTQKEHAVTYKLSYLLIFWQVLLVGGGAVAEALQPTLRLGNPCVA